MLSDHLYHNGIMRKSLNAAQVAAFQAITRKIADGTYVFEVPICPTCGGNHYLPLAERDRYGLEYHLVSCVGCGLWQVSPRLTAASLQDFYANHYRNLYHGEVVAAAAHSAAAVERGRMALNLISNERPLLPGARVVEIGCAAGAQLIPFRIAECSVAGYDYDENIVGIGRTEHGLDLRSGGVEDLIRDVAAGDARPDAILYIHVFEHLSDPREELRQLASVLAPGGLLYLELPGLSRCVRTREIFFDAYFEFAHTYHFDRSTLAALVNASGWRCLWSDNFVRAVLTPATEEAPYIDTMHATIGAAEKAQQLLAAPDADPEAIVTALLQGGASHAQAFFQAGEYLFNQKDARALGYLQHASDLDPSRGKYTFLLARAMLLHDGAAPANLLSTLQRAVNQLPDSPYPAFHLGRALFATGRKDEAVGYYASAIRMKPDIAIFHYWQGLALKDLGATERALACFSTACALENSMPYAQYELALTLGGLGRKAEAIVAMDKAISQKADPRFTSARAMLAALPD